MDAVEVFGKIHPLHKIRGTDEWYEEVENILHFLIVREVGRESYPERGNSDED